MASKPFLSIPEREYGPVPWYAWLGELTCERIDLHLRRFLDMGIHEIIPIPLYGLKPKYMGPEYMALYRHLCRRCRQWGLKVWIYDEFNWPSGTCAGQVLAQFPEARQRVIRFAWPDKDFQQQPTCKIVDHDGFDLAAYGAEWALNTTGYLDTLNARAVRTFIDLTHEAYKRELGAYFGDVIVGFFTDEPVAVRGGCFDFPYTPGLFEKFAQRYGYSLEENLLLLATEGADSLKVRRHYWALVIELFQDSYFRQCAAWCERNGLQLTGHLLYEEILQGNLHDNGDMYAMLSQLHVPGIDQLGSRTSFDRGERVHRWGSACWDVTGKFIESIRFFAGRKRSLCEAFGCTPNSDTAQDYKRAADFLFHHGLSMINDNLFADSSSSFRKFCGCHSFWTPWVRHYGAFSRHIATLSYLNAESRLHTEVALYYPGLDIRVRYGTPATMYGSGADRDASWERTQKAIYQISHGLIARHWDFYYVFDQVLDSAKTVPGGLDIAGFTCRALVLPDIHYVPAEVADVLDRFLDVGGHVLAIGQVPSVLRANGTVAKRGWAHHPRMHLIQCTPRAPAGKLAAVLAQCARREIKLVGSKLQEVMLTHRSSHGIEQLFLTNFGRATVRFSAGIDESWQELDTVSRTVRKTDPRVIQLAPNESVLFVRKSSERVEPPCPEAPATVTRVVTMAPEWDLHLPEGNTCLLPVQIYRGDPGTAPPEQTADADWHEPCTEVPPIELEPERSYWLRSQVTLRYAAAELSLVVDGGDHSEVWVNGGRIEFDGSRRLWDDDNRSANLSGVLKPGRNDIVIRHTPARARRFAARMLRSSPDMAPFALVGNFAARTIGNGVMLSPVPEHVRPGTLYDQGLANFVGVAEYEQSIELPNAGSGTMLHLGFQRDAFEIVVNGTSAGAMLWPPYRVLIGHLLKPGPNTITLRLHTAMGGLLRRNFAGIEHDRPPIGLVDTPRLLIAE